MSKLNHKLHFFNDVQNQLKQSNILEVFNELTNILNSIDEEEIIFQFNSENKKTKSISDSLTSIFSQNLLDNKWISQQHIFKALDNIYDTSWMFDFYKNDVSLEICFDHAGVIIKNLLTAEVGYKSNKIEKLCKSSLSIFIVCSKEMKKLGGFDRAIGDIDKYISAIEKLSNIITTPIVLISLNAPKTFKVVHQKIMNSNQGIIHRYNEL